MQLFRILEEEHKKVNGLFWWAYTAVYIVGPFVMIAILALLPNKKGCHIPFRGRLVGIALGGALYLALRFVWIDFEYCLPLSMHNTATIIGVGFLISFIGTFAFWPVLAHFSLMGMLMCGAGVTGYFMDTIQFMAWMTIIGPVLTESTLPEIEERYLSDEVTMK